MHIAAIRMRLSSTTVNTFKKYYFANSTLNTTPSRKSDIRITFCEKLNHFKSLTYIIVEWLFKVPF